MRRRGKEGFWTSGAGRTELPLSELEKEVRNKSGRYSLGGSSHYKFGEAYSGSEIGSAVGM